MKGQASTEFIVIIATLTLIMLPIVMLMNFNMRYSQENMALATATFSASRLASAADAVGSMGFGAMLHTTIEMPQVDYISVKGHDISIGMKTTWGDVVVVQASRFVLEGSGFDRIREAGTYTVQATSPQSSDQGEKVHLSLR